MESTKQMVPIVVGTTTSRQQTPAEFNLPTLLFRVLKSAQIVLVLAELALTILYIKADSSSDASLLASKQCIDPSAKTNLLIALSILQLLFGIVMVLTNFHRTYERILLPCSASLVIYLNARYAYAYYLFVSVYYYREKLNNQIYSGTGSTQRSKFIHSLPAECAFPLWLDLVTLAFFHLFLLVLYFHLRAVSRRFSGGSGSTEGSSSSTDKAPVLPLPTYAQVAKNPTKYPQVANIEAASPAYPGLPVAV
ncbi:hypothetical protein TYRP_010321 [Tyrophagus putrescentiae]|nr:hypothetical protein TYRP_010321 [Tyrophagus putrescentiae]